VVLEELRHLKFSMTLGESP